MRPILPVLLALLPAACASDRLAHSVAGGQEPTAASAAPVRPRDPWVFRSVLDGNARMLTVALSEHLWVAFDVHHGQLWRAWNGDVALTGAVYDAQHGPQPVARGEDYLAFPDHEPAGPGEVPDPPGEGWRFEDGTPAQLVWRGHRFAGGRVTLLWSLVAEGREPVAVALSPESVGVAGAAELELAMAVGGLREGERVACDLPPFAADAAAVRTAGAAQVAEAGVVLRSGATWLRVQSMAGGARPRFEILLGPGESLLTLQLAPAAQPEGAR